MDSLTDENQSVFVKTNKIDPVFYRFTENRSVEFEIFKILINFEIKNPKKLAFILRFFNKTEFKNSKYFIVKNSCRFKGLLKKRSAQLC
jgi:hypothetical protein